MGPEELIIGEIYVVDISCPEKEASDAHFDYVPQIQQEVRLKKIVDRHCADGSIIETAIVEVLGQDGTKEYCTTCLREK